MDPPAQRAKALFLDVVEIEPPEQRAIALERACAGDEALRLRVEALLAAHERPESLLDRPAADVDLAPTLPLTNTEPARPGEGVGTVIGPYTLGEPIGEGGMGVVYLAEQATPVRRQVALKVIRPGMDTAQVVARFEAERQALALMDHPNIAKVHDGGVTPTGRPYFVMELVQGVPITEYCDEHRLDPRRRLELFLPVCQAIQHAHQKGIIHRDIKPSNVMVTEVDGRPVPKVIDFGVAKAIDQRLTERTLTTGLGAVVGTPEYMSPEQASAGQDIDTRSDIYGLGVLLYELLTGSTPLERESLRRVALEVVLKRVREEEPPKPSTRLGGSGERLPSVAAVRGVEPARLAKLVRGDLDWIVMKSLEKDRARRYETASGLARDLQRHLDGDPVEAGPPSRTYRLRKFARKHRASLATVGAFGAVLLAATGISLALAANAARARDEARRARDVADRARRATDSALERAERRTRQARRAVDQMYTEFAEDWLAERPGATPHQRRLLERALGFYGEFAAAPGSDPSDLDEAASAAARVGSILLKLGRLPEAELALEDARDRRAALAGRFPDRPEYRLNWAASVIELGNFSRAAGRPTEAEAAYREALALVEPLTDAPPDLAAVRPIEADALANLALTLAEAGRAEKAEPLFRRAVELGDRILADRPDDHRARRGRANTLNNLGYLLSGLPDRAAEAEATYRRALELAGPLAAPADARAADRELLAMILNNLAAVLLRDRRADEAEAALRRAVAAERRLVEAEPGQPDYRHVLAVGLVNLGSLLRSNARTDDALDALGEAIELLDALHAERPESAEWTLHLAGALTNLGNALAETDRVDETIAAYIRSAEAYDALPAPHRDDPPVRGRRAYPRGEAALVIATHPDPDRRDPSRAVELAAQAVVLEPEKAGHRFRLALARLRAGEAGAAVADAESAYALSPDPGVVGDLICALVLARSGQNEEARRHRERALDALERRPTLVAVINRLRREIEAEPVLRECLAFRTATLPDVWSRFNSMSELGGSLLGQNRFEEAEPLVVGGYEGMKAREATIPAPALVRLPEAAERVVRLYEAWGKPDEAAAWRETLGLPATELPDDVFARP